MAGRALCAIHQPNLFPRLSTLAKLFAADSWVALDDVQFVRRDYQHRARLRSLLPAPRDHWLSLPVHLPDGRATAIRDVTLADPAGSSIRVQRMAAQCFARSPHWPLLRDELERVVSALGYCDRLAPIAELSTVGLLRLLGWTGAVHRSSDYRVRSGRTDRLVDLTSALGASTYLCGTGGARYLDHEAFDQADLMVEHFTVPHYDQLGLWEDAGRVSALFPLMQFGPAVLADELKASATRWRLAQTVVMAG